MAATGSPPAHLPAPPPPVGGVHVWRVELDGDPVALALPDERDRAARLRDERQRARFLASRAWLRQVLGRYAGVDAAAVRFAVSERGKPRMVDGGGLCFSLSRSGHLALIAVAEGRDVGVDVERIVGDLDHCRLTERFFSDGEAEVLRALPEPDQRSAFFQLWVRKEAVVKTSGAGLGDGLSHLDVRASGVAGRWSVASVDAGTGFAAAVAVEGPLGPVSTWSTTPHDLG